MNAPLPKNQRANDVVTFTYFAPSAAYVSVAGNFNHWNPKSMPMHKDEDGVWRLNVILEPGPCDYQFFVDGVWHDDPSELRQMNKGTGL